MIRKVIYKRLYTIIFYTELSLNISSIAELELFLTLVRKLTVLER